MPGDALTFFFMEDIKFVGSGGIYYLHFATAVAYKAFRVRENSYFYGLDVEVEFSVFLWCHLKNSFSLLADGGWCEPPATSADFVISFLEESY